MMENLEYGFTTTMLAEGVEYVNDPNDRGGPTKMGLTLGLMKNMGLDLNKDGRVTMDDVHLVTELVVLAVYKREFWNRVKANDLSSGRDVQTADLAFNAGPYRANVLYRATANIDTFAIEQIYYYLGLADGLPGYVGFFRGLTRRALQTHEKASRITEGYQATNRQIAAVWKLLREADEHKQFRGVFREKVREALSWT
jgi:hypothetical protein